MFIYVFHIIYLYLESIITVEFYYVLPLLMPQYLIICSLCLDYVTNILVFQYFIMLIPWHMYFHYYFKMKHSIQNVQEQFYDFSYKYLTMFNYTYF